MRNLLLSTVTLLVVPAVSIAAPEFNTHTYTTPIELRPISQLDKAYKTAGICFLGVGDCAPNAGFDSAPSTGGGDDEDFDINTGNQCLNEGFTKQSCNSVQTIDGVCPYNSAYGRGCKCVSNLIECPAGQVGVGESCDGKYASCKCDPNLISCSEKEVGQGASCGGRYESCVCKAEYKYTSSNCSYPQSVSGDSCSGKYTNCICPTGVSYGKFGCEEFYPSPCSSVCKIAYVDACYMLKDNTSIYGCMKYWDGCKTKCETPYKDNCRNQNAVSIPANAHCTSYYSDCSSKCSGWSCDPGYKESGNSCIVSGPICEIGYIFYSDNTCVPYTQHDSGKTVLGIVAYVTNGGKHGQIISPWRINSAGNISKSAGASWSTKKTGNIYYGTSSSASMNYDSCANTDKIVAQGDDRTYPAAWATRYYAPTAETKGKWCLPAAGIMSSIYKNQTVIQEAITAVGGVEFASCCYWSSSPYSRSEAWVSDLSSSYGLAHIAKSNFRYVRPVLEY